MQHHRTESSPRRQAPDADSVPADWPAMLDAEPRLRILAKATAAAARIRCDRRSAWIVIRDELRNLVGWFAPDPRLNSSAHWNVAAGRLRHLLATGGRR